MPRRRYDTFMNTLRHTKEHWSNISQQSSEVRMARRFSRRTWPPRRVSWISHPLETVQSSAETSRDDLYAW